MDQDRRKVPRVKERDPLVKELTESLKKAADNSTQLAHELNHVVLMLEEHNELRKVIRDTIFVDERTEDDSDSGKQAGDSEGATWVR